MGERTHGDQASARDWFPALQGADVLCLASGGGQQERGEPLEFSHTLEDQIGGIEAGFVIAGLCEDRHRDDPIAAHMPTYIATRAIK